MYSLNKDKIRLMHADSCHENCVLEIDEYFHERTTI